METAAEATEALDKLRDSSFDIVLFDIKMPGMDGIELQRRLKEIDSQLAIIIMTAYATVDTAVQALKQGAYDYITKPVDPDDLSRLIRNAVVQRRLIRENLSLKEEIQTLISVDFIVGESRQIQEVLKLIQTVAQTDVTVMIQGASGTGKEPVARAIHFNSRRKYFPLITINCGALTDTLVESELFGHERGAFTGAQYRRKGKLELAHKGAIFFDEIGNIGPKTQMDLLRVIETKQFTRLGGNEVVEADFRIISATNKNLEDAVKDGTFREDLYYRLNVFNIQLPSLKERASDIPLLVTIEFAGEREIECLRDQLEARFQTKVDVSRSDFDCRAFMDLHRNQYSSSAIIERLEQHLPTADSKVLAVTGLDLYIPVLTFVFGEARLNGQCAVVSSYRLDNKFYGLPDKPALLQERLLKEAIHELGHTYGLFHCHNPECVMKSSTYVEEIDFKSSRFCDKCWDKLAK